MKIAKHIYLNVLPKISIKREVKGSEINPFTY